VKRVLKVVGVLFAVWFATAFAIVVVHHDDEPAPADAVVVLQGSRTRLPIAYRLVRDGYAPLLVVSRGSRTKLEDRVCAGRTDVRALCFRATSTRGEARQLGRLARERGLRTVNVVTSHFHVFRARILLERCYHGELRMVGAPQSTWRLPKDMVDETLKLAYQLVYARGC
jgi:uncharacterized SAM-binding protein YcdF (DUF218 family)